MNNKYVISTVISVALYGAAIYTAIKVAEKNPPSKDPKELIKQYALPGLLFASGVVINIAQLKLFSSELVGHELAYSVAVRNLDSLKFALPQKTLDEAEEVKASKALDSVMIPSNLFVLGPNQVYVLDALTGQFFVSNLETIKRAELELNHVIQTEGTATMYDYEHSLGLAPTKDSSYIGWTQPVVFEIRAKLKDGTTPCLYIDPPTPRKI